MKQADVVVIGAGPAGLAAAAVAVEGGATTVVIDDNPEVGGQLLRSRASGARTRMPGMVKSGAAERRGRIEAAGGEILTGTIVWSIEDASRIHLYSPASNSTRTIDARAIIVATGARELVRPFPGWTLPGVMTIGGGQNLMKAQGILPGKRVAVAGSGPFLWLVAHQLVQAGAEVRMVAEASAPAAIVSAGLGGLRFPSMLGEAIAYWTTLARARIPLRFGTAAIAAGGTDTLRDVTFAKLDASGRAVPGTEWTEPVDALCVSNGLIPSVELTQHLGCTHHFDESTSAPAVVVDDLCETSVPGVFAAGEVSGIGGGPVAEWKGEIAGLGALARLGLLTPDAARMKAAPANRKRAARGGFVTQFSRTFAPSSDFCGLADSETIVCRCEEVTLGDIQRAMAHGDNQPDSVKSRTRCGMGMCQGRTCGPTLARYMASQAGRPVSELTSLTVRTPVRPVPIGALINHKLEG